MGLCTVKRKKITTFELKIRLGHWVFDRQAEEKRLKDTVSAKIVPRKKSTSSRKIRTNLCKPVSIQGKRRLEFFSDPEPTLDLKIRTSLSLRSSSAWKRVQ